jgi:myo-inositol-1(or 4)-monophosphatase
MNPRLQLALTLLPELRAELLDAFERGAHRLEHKAVNDFATETDRRVEARIAEAVGRDFPGDRLLGEEGGERGVGTPGTPSGWRWIVDPLDGTFNFVHGFPWFATSIAIADAAGVAAAAILNPVTGEIFHAERGGGSWLDAPNRPRMRLAVSRASQLSTALIGSVLPSPASDRFATVWPLWCEVATRAGSIRRTGAAALDLAQVAAGRMDGFFVASLAAWDAAAGELLVREAGGVMCDFAGGARHLETNQVIAGSAPIAGQLVRVLQHAAVI